MNMPPPPNYRSSYAVDSHAAIAQHLPDLDVRRRTYVAMLPWRKLCPNSYHAMHEAVTTHTGHGDTTQKTQILILTNFLITNYAFGHGFQNMARCLYVQLVSITKPPPQGFN